MLRLLFLIADSVRKNGTVSNASIEPRWLKCHKPLWKAADVRDLLMFYSFYFHRRGRLEFGTERPRDGRAAGSDGAVPGPARAAGILCHPPPEPPRRETTAHALPMKRLFGKGVGQRKPGQKNGDIIKN